VGGFALGLWGSYRAVFPAKGLHRLTVVFQARAGETTLLVSHGAAPALAMAPMELMAFDLESPGLLAGVALEKGDLVRLTLRRTGPDRYLVVGIEKVR
jgi:hypothetical protein